MNRQKAIQDCKTSMLQWPRSIHSQLAPGGWEWVKRYEAYKRPEIVLRAIDNKTSYIKKSDVF